MKAWRLVRARRPLLALKITKFQIFRLRAEKCSSVWSYDKNISTLWQKLTFKRPTNYINLNDLLYYVAWTRSNCNPRKTNLDTFRTKPRYETAYPKFESYYWPEQMHTMHISQWAFNPQKMSMSFIIIQIYFHELYFI